MSPGGPKRSLRRKICSHLVFLVLLNLCIATTTRGGDPATYLAALVAAALSAVNDAIQLGLHTTRSVEAWAIFGAGGVLYILSQRAIDERVHLWFYDPTRHRNRCRGPLLINLVGQRGIRQFRLAFMAMAGAGDAVDAARRLVVGSIWVSLLKGAFKAMAPALFGARAAFRRPASAAYPRGLVTSNGLPSGHAAQAALVAVFFCATSQPEAGGMRAITLAQLAATTAWTIASNRHTFSQTLAGLVLGAIFAAGIVHWHQAAAAASFGGCTQRPCA